MRRAPLVLAILSAALATACTAGDDVAPTLTVTSPERGTLSETGTVTVTGTVTDDDLAEIRVTVAGQPAEVAADGSFTATVDLVPGIEVIETLASDDAGNLARDVRAVMSGNLVPTGAMVSQGVGANLGPQALTLISQIVGETVEGMDLAALAGTGPVVSKGSSCLGADVYVLDVATANVDVGLAAQTGAIDTAVTVAGLDVTVRVDYAIACVDQTATIVVHADSVGMRGALGLEVGAGTLASALDDLDVTIVGLDLESDGLPGTILDLIEGPLEAALPGLLEGVVTDAVPGLVDDLLADLMGKSWTAPVLGHDIQIAIRPAAVQITTAGALIAMDTRMNVSEDVGGMYLSSPSSATAALANAGSGIGLAVADDAMNQLFAGLWASGALEHDLPVERGNSLGLLLGETTRTLRASLALPPQVSMDAAGDLHLTIGDAIIRGLDGDGAEVVTMALSISTTLGAEAYPDGHIKLRLGDPQVWAQVLSQSPALDPQIESSQVEALVGGLYDVLAATANQALAGLPIPAIAGVSMVDPSAEASGGFLVVKTGLARQ